MILHDGTMFPLLAARGGTVYRYNTTCPDGIQTAVQLCGI